MPKLLIGGVVVLGLLAGAIGGWIVDMNQSSLIDDRFELICWEDGSCRVEMRDISITNTLYN
jgi:hypothetical protein